VTAKRKRLLAVASIVAVAFIALALAVAHRTEPLRLDKTVDDFLFLKQESSPRDWAGHVTLLGSARVVAVLTVLVAMLAVALRRSVALIVWCLATPSVAGVLEIVLKRAVGRESRTSIVPRTGVAQLVHPPYTFPSGHVVGIAAVVTVAVVVLGTTPRRRLFLSTAGAVVVLVIGYTRVAVGAHTFTDVVGGLLLGLVIGTTAAALRPNASARWVE
jgi:membrane-associated phospholipid phosphatase